MKDDYILIVDDELPIREMIHTSWTWQAFSVYRQKMPNRLIKLSSTNVRRLSCSIDVTRGVSGVDLCRRLKRDENLAEIPVIMLTARGEEDHKVQGLDAGADDYMTKPFSTRELVSRIKAVLRRANALSGENN